MALAESLEKVYKLPMGTLAQAITPQPVARAAERVGPILQERFSVMPQGQMTNEETAIMEIAKEAEMSTDPEEKEGLMSMIEKLQAQAIAPMGSVAQELAAMGGGEDTALAHVRPGEVVVPPEIVQDPEVESLLESKFNQMGINPEEAVVGIGIASLNPNTGLEQFGFFKKIGKKLGKVVKKVAPIAGALMIPGIGGALGGALSSAGSALGIPSGIGSSFLGGKGILDKAASIRGGIGNLIRAKKPGQSGIGRIEDLIKGRKSDEVREGGGIFDIFQGQQDEQIVYDKEGNPIRIPRSGGGFGDMLKIGGIGALAAGLGKLAYDEAKDQKGVPLTPLTTMDAVGRYNIEAEIARRMGQQAPNPVEFGLLPEGTLPELSGGKPRGMYGGGIVMPMAYAEGGNVAMEDFERMNGRIDGPGTETSDDIPAMLSDGEFVMTGRAVRGAGSFDMQNSNGIVTLTPNGSPDRESGTDLMYQLMEVFSGQARPSA